MTEYVVRLASQAMNFRDYSEGKQRPVEDTYISSWRPTRTAGLIGTGAMDIGHANGITNERRTWKTREAAERVAERFTTEYRTYVVEEA